jgi:hypothetical protein
MLDLAAGGLTQGATKTRHCWWRYHNQMTLKKTTVMVDDEDLRIIKEAAAREGRPESEYFREAFHIAALRARRWSGEWDIPEFDFGAPITEEDVRAASQEAAHRAYGGPGSVA